MSRIVLKCEGEWLKSENLLLLKKLTSLGYSEICRRINENKPVAEFTLFLNDYGEIKEKLIAFIEKADEKDLSFILYEFNEENPSESNKPEVNRITKQILINIFEQSEEIKRELEKEDEIRFS